MKGAEILIEKLYFGQHYYYKKDILYKIIS